MAAKRETEQKLNYKAEVRRLKENGPERLYLLHGPEDYLRTAFLAELRKVALEGGEDDFSYHRLGAETDSIALGEAINSVPFLSERSLVEVHNADLNKLKDAESEAFLSLLRDIPEYCTVAFVQSANYSLDGRTKFVKALKGIARELKFTEQSDSALVDWCARRFAAQGKTADFEAITRLIFVSGNLMNRLIPEIDKIAAYTKGERVTTREVNAVASHIPEADVFEMTEYIAKREFALAASTLGELFAAKQEPIAILALLAHQLRQLYCARLCIDRKLPTKYLMETCGIKYDFVAKKHLSAARGFTLAELKKSIEICAEMDYRLKSSAENDEALVKEAVMRIAASEVNHAAR